jgi:hypothetical protein
MTLTPGIKSQRLFIDNFSPPLPPFWEKNKYGINNKILKEFYPQRQLQHFHLFAKIINME